MEYTPLKLHTSLSVDAVYTVFYDRYPKNFHFPGESHNFWELDCIIRGKAGFTSGVQIYECGPYELVIHPPGIFHTCWAEDDEGFGSMTISFSGKGMDYFLPFGKFILKGEDRFLIDNLLTVISDTFPIPGKIEQAPDLKMQTFKNLFELLLITISQNTSRAMPTLSKNAIMFSGIAEYMQERVCDNIRTEDICRKFGISRSTLKDMFHRFTGGGVMEYYQYLRVSHAIMLLSDGVSMAEISAKMNFSSQNYFSSFFKRETGMSPMEYRKKKI